MAIAVHVIGPSPSPSSSIVALSFLFVFLIISPVYASLTESDALLRLKVSIKDPTGALQSWVPGTAPCDENKVWRGLTCGPEGLRGIQLENMNLSGTIDIFALLQVTTIRSISFQNNSFSGPIPEFNKLGSLKSLFLSGNQFSGEIPDNYFENMQSLKKIHLAYNQFSGEIPSSLTDIPNLMELYIHNNKFSGNIPDFQQKSLQVLDMSRNNLTGGIPEGLSDFGASSFEGNSDLCGKELGKPCPEPINKPKLDEEKISGKKDSDGIGIYVLIALVMVLFIFTAIFVLRSRKRKPRFNVLEKEHLPEVAVQEESKKEPETVPRRNTKSPSRKALLKNSSQSRAANDVVIVNDERGVFGLADLMKAAAEVLGNGSLGSSYKATMAGGLTVVVKRVKDMNRLAKEAFDSQMRSLAKLKHSNIIAPLAYHYRKDEKLIVNEYMPKGSLLYILHGDRGIFHAELKWPIRLKIIQGVARGLAYLHTELSDLELPHGNLRSSNVLLTEEYEPLLADFGFHSLVTENQAAQALFAYKSPEAILNLKVSPKSDVYCLGVIILELMTGKFPCQYHSNNNGGTDILQWVRSAIAEGREGELIDPDIAGSNNTSEMEKLLHIGAACIESNPEQRLDLREAVRRIEEVYVEGGMAQQVRQVPSLRDGLS